MTGDGVPDLIVGSGPGIEPGVEIYDGLTQELWTHFAAFESPFVGGVNVAAGDVTGDGIAEIVVAPRSGGGPRVRVFSEAGNTLLADFWGLSDSAFRGGLHVGLADLNGDGKADLLVGAGAGGGPRVARYDGATFRAGTPEKLFADFFAFSADQTSGVQVSGGDVNGDGVGDVIAAAGEGGGPRVLILSGDDLVTSGTLGMLIFSWEATE